MKKILMTFKTKTTNALKRACKAYVRNFQEIYGPVINAGVNPFN